MIGKLLYTAFKLLAKFVLKPLLILAAGAASEYPKETAATVVPLATLWLFGWPGAIVVAAVGTIAYIVNTTEVGDRLPLGN